MRVPMVARSTMGCASPRGFRKAESRGCGANVMELRRTSTTWSCGPSMGLCGSLVLLSRRVKVWTGALLLRRSSRRCSEVSIGMQALESCGTLAGVLPSLKLFDFARVQKAPGARVQTVEFDAAEIHANQANGKVTN